MPKPLNPPIQTPHPSRQTEGDHASPFAASRHTQPPCPPILRRTVDPAHIKLSGTTTPPHHPPAVPWANPAPPADTPTPSLPRHTSAPSPPRAHPAPPPQATNPNFTSQPRPPTPLPPPRRKGRATLSPTASPPRCRILSLFCPHGKDKPVNRLLHARRYQARPAVGESHPPASSPTPSTLNQPPLLPLREQTRPPVDPPSTPSLSNFVGYFPSLLSEKLSIPVSRFTRQNNLLFV